MTVTFRLGTGDCLTTGSRTQSPCQAVISGKFRPRLHLEPGRKVGRGPAARDFLGRRGGEGGAHPRRSVTLEPTKPLRKRPAAHRVLAQTARWLRCTSVTDPYGYPPSSRLAIGPFALKQDPFLLFGRALKGVHRQ